MPQGNTQIHIQVIGSKRHLLSKTNHCNNYHTVKSLEKSRPRVNNIYPKWKSYLI